VSAVLPYSVLKPQNVDATKEIIRLAVTAKLKTINYISTTGVFSHQRNPIPEIAEPPGSYINFSSGYNQSKWVSEGLLRQANSRGVPIRIIRPGSIYADTVTGYDNHDDLVNRLIRGIIELHAYPLVKQELDLSPVDWVASGIISICSTKDTIGGVFHFTNLQSRLTISRLGEWIASFGCEVKGIEYSEWKNLLKSSPSNSLAPFLQTYFVGASFPDSGKFETSNTRNALEKFGHFFCPVITEQLVHKNLAHMKQRNDF